jgi:ATP synthase protein I
MPAGQASLCEFSMSQSSGGGRGDDRDLRSIKDRLSTLDKKLDSAQDRQPREVQDPGARGEAMGFALRIATELVAGVFVGALLGWALDKWLGTAPILLIVCLLLGIAGGLLNSVRAARRMQDTNRT